TRSARPPGVGFSGGRVGRPLKSGGCPGDGPDSVGPRRRPRRGEFRQRSRRDRRSSFAPSSLSHEGGVANHVLDPSKNRGGGRADRSGSGAGPLGLPTGGGRDTRPRKQRRTQGG